MMGKLPLGVVSPYVKMSSGGCTDPLKFYATSYCTAYGREDFKPRVGIHEGTGYKSNYRPVVSYQPHLDALDNPAMGEQVCNNFQTVTSQSYRPLEVPDGTYPLPRNLHQTSSGYSREKASAVTPIKEDYGPQAITGLEPKNVPLLHQQQNKGSLEWENARHVPPPCPEPSSMNHWQFQSPQRMQQTNVALLGRETVGNKEPSGFSLNNPSYVRSPYDPDMDNRYLTTYNQGPPDPWSWLPPHLWDPEPLAAMWASKAGLSFADLLQKNSIGAKEETGFTEESNKNPIVFQPPSQALPGDPVSQAGTH
ncbi:PPP1R32 [Cervus elaphus hippelaphus]|uniref:PPP1R32 n=1 Tax=Cervus elaphus hippelaphus TaxID=46360 RepID=A0A212DGT4_CEREH|nr:PPP1R32 [Cervus elaphus hippelaphus]